MGPRLETIRRVLKRRHGHTRVGRFTLESAQRRGSMPCDRRLPRSDGAAFCGTAGPRSRRRATRANACETSAITMRPQAARR
ncbi:Hypothetical protein A7982_03374 [Minicystis rosea]|nr:Hypothetical protein A7982_03374 [Minicystis rosea]